ncbi:MAG: hypothetical protein M3P32_08775 [Chloroflexota bacterium]|nr:hypothetical protein [Chloroflexota bacterium]
MGRPSGLSVVVLVAAGMILCLAGAASAGVGWLNPRLVSDRLPPDAAIDAPAVGGAAVALGVAVVMLGLIHLLVAFALRRGIGVAPTAGVVLAATMAALSFGFAVSALVSIASGVAPAALMLPASIVLGGAVIAYGATTMAIISARKGPI